ncbi:hypothetical protein [Tengunoibacter tsumagoiensis]|uniref:Uncharacterized protein n=1 Tax=Tengunoibacter tsumagoiensis TaxID=2014871 RepID=A0A402A4R1_9CHLR|nr:hypothetical protein [Tengunoibacter tsumagoiensis]GCE13991.1 hypothetical protein KTT_38500 [Tengunoibacter tsumagoiensis]
MNNDSLETLLGRHYGPSAPTPAHLEQRLVSSLMVEAAQQNRQRHEAARLREYRLSRRRAVKLVAIGSASLGLLSAGLEGIHLAESNMFGRELAHPVLS